MSWQSASLLASVHHVLSAFRQLTLARRAVGVVQLLSAPDTSSGSGWYSDVASSVPGPRALAGCISTMRQRLQDHFCHLLVDGIVGAVHGAHDLCSIACRDLKAARPPSGSLSGTSFQPIIAPTTGSRYPSTTPALRGTK
eukprot:CAMPEP_0196757332 /NCGR_PEP_ID=MMETSP1091-20130531/103611_1 /TAXON_ID=302021 /ORGANISM="Rhodomonas sp., Strain CCMP768" /LENGTH=139 /DNA_ID=CAMNT_0042106105 /DNA_START=1552 /DNA_END=1971 /DNA_ORIENTATION=+